MPELLLEVGCEELPASFVERAYNDLEAKLMQRLGEENLLEEGASSQSLGTPRRLIVCIQGVKAQQPDTEKTQRGPALAAAYNAAGEPTPALLGFCKGAGVEVSAVTKDEKYVWVTKLVKGQSAEQLLAEILPASIRSIQFDKSMRWGAGKMRFARPIRWILALFDGKGVPFQVETVTSGTTSRGHRFYANQDFPVSSFSDLMTKLAEHKVEPSKDKRRERILSEALRSTGKPILSEALVDENVFLTEWPDAVHGEFKESFLNLPRPVLITAMAKHEKMFPVEDNAGNLVNQFVFIRNGGEDATVKAGNQWVLNARFNDAQFFFNEDKKKTLDDFLEKTQNLMFGRDLGTVRQRTSRLEELIKLVSDATGADANEKELARKAARYALADLSTGLVSELPALQGVIGAEYAARENFPAEVVAALANQYDPSKVAGTATAAERTSYRLILASQIDKLTGYLALGQLPSGSSDPYGLRRSASQLIEIAWAWPEFNQDLSSLFDAATRLYKDQSILPADAVAPLDALRGLFSSRYEALLGNFSASIRQAATGEGANLLAPRSIRFRCEVLDAVGGDENLVQTATRPLNLVSSAKSKGSELAPFGPALREAIDSAEGAALFDRIQTDGATFQAAVESENRDEVARLLQSWIAPINAFFDSTMIMAEDPKVRASRLGLLNRIASLLGLVGDFSKL